MHGRGCGSPPARYVSLPLVFLACGTAPSAGAVAFIQISHASLLSMLTFSPLTTQLIAAISGSLAACLILDVLRLMGISSTPPTALTALLDW